MTTGDIDSMQQSEPTDAMQSAIRGAHAEGLSQAQIAVKVGVPQPTISRWSKRMGLLWNSGRTATANQIARERIMAKRLILAEQFLADVESIRERFWSEYTVIANTPSGPERVLLDLPDAKAVADIASAIERLVKAHENLSRLGAASGADHAKSVLMQMQTDLQRFVEDYDKESAGDQAVTTPALNSANVSDIGLPIRSSGVIDHE